MKSWSPAKYSISILEMKRCNKNGTYKGVYLIDNETSQLLRQYAASGGYLIRLSWSVERHKNHPVQGDRPTVKEDTVDPCIAKLSGITSVLTFRIVVRSVNYLFSWARTLDCKLIQSRV